MDNGGLKITQVRLLPRALHMGQASSSHPWQSMLRVDWDKKKLWQWVPLPGDPRFLNYRLESR